MEFEERLRKAVERGRRRGEADVQAARREQMSEEELKSLHSQYRLLLSEHIEHCIQKLPNYFPGFRCETMFGDRGWGVACYRDDLALGSGGQRENLYSRLEMSVRPYSPQLHVLDLAAKGTIRNREVFNRNHFEKLEEVDTDTFRNLIDVWILEYAELYAAKV